MSSPPSSDPFFSVPSIGPPSGAQLPPPMTTSSPSRRAPKQPCTNLSCTERGQRGGHLHGQCTQKYCRSCCEKSGVPCNAPRHNDPTTVVINSVTVASFPPVVASSPATPHSSASDSSPPPFTYERPMGKMIDPSYAKKLIAGDHDLTPTSRFQREVYRKANMNTIKIKWWTTDDMPPDVLAVAAPNFPWFLPKDSEAIIKLVGLDNCTTYAYWDGQDWILTDVAMQVKANTTSFIRSPHVKVCPGGPQPKRRLSDADTPTPTRARMDEPHPIISPIKLTPAVQNNNSVGSISSDEEDEDNDSKNEAAPSSDATLTGVFPLKYACEMDENFKTMALLEGSVPERFTAVFNVGFIRSTYYAHWGPWHNMSPNDLSAAVRLGKNPGGEWNTALRRFGKRKA
ncbi:hypothetical protein DFH09DRAFT_1103287 [Mycena vulgaris]|nr:hypothetical protein DFH09DRAFT_1103287 [Mycena vulgaris]